jgi:hypothetical protein
MPVVLFIFSFCVVLVGWNISLVGIENKRNTVGYGRVLVV